MQSPSKHSAVATGRSLAMRAFQTSFPVISRKQAPSKASKAAGAVNCSFVVVMALLALLLIMFVARARTPSRYAYGHIKTNCLSRINRQQQGSNSTTAAGVASIAGEQVVWRRPVIVLLGDGLTEQASMEGGWATKLAAAYTRKADVLNRGFEGYSSSAVLNILPELLPLLAQPQVPLVTVMLGTTDAAHQDTAQGKVLHVPASMFKGNLMVIVHQLLEAGVHNVVVVSPPPVNDTASDTAQGPLRHSNSALEPYATAAKQVAQQASLPFLDLRAVFEQQQGWQQQFLQEDGVHLTAAGNEAVFKALMLLVDQQLPRLRPAALPVHHVTWLHLGKDAGKSAVESEAQTYRAAVEGC